MYADDCLIYLSITVKDASLAVHCIMLGRQHLLLNVSKTQLMWLG